MADPIKEILEEATKKTVGNTAEEVLAQRGGPPAPPDPITPPGGGGGGGGGSTDTGGSSSGGSTSSGGSSGGSAPADPDAPLISAAKSVYMKLWGQAPPSNYVEQAIHSGMNIWEFEDHERHKPAFRKTKTYRDEGETLAALLHQLGVA